MASPISSISRAACLHDGDGDGSITPLGNPCDRKDATRPMFKCLGFGIPHSGR